MKKNLSIYLIHPISGLTYEQVMGYYQEKRALYESLGYTVFSPMTGKKQLRPESEYRAHGIVGNPVATNHAIFERDVHCVQSVDVCLADLLGCKNVSIGSCMELAIASYLRKHTVTIMEGNNPHAHAFVYEASDTVFETEPEARAYLEQWIGGSQ